METLAHFRKAKDEFFRTGDDSPLTSEQKIDFSGLKYFPENPLLVFNLPIDKNMEEETILRIQTSSGDEEPYKRYGKIKFNVGEEETILTVFQEMDGSSLFLPFRDKTSTDETYESGRYVDVEEEDGKLNLDFNYAYNPYCAYNPRWRCPLTPFENNLKVKIEAGEKKFHE